MPGPPGVGRKSKGEGPQYLRERGKETARWHKKRGERTAGSKVHRLKMEWKKPQLKKKEVRKSRLLNKYFKLKKYVN